MPAVFQEVFSNQVAVEPAVGIWESVISFLELAAVRFAVVETQDSRSCPGNHGRHHCGHARARLAYQKKRHNQGVNASGGLVLEYGRRVRRRRVTPVDEKVSPNDEDPSRVGGVSSGDC